MSSVQQLSTGHVFPECPRWHEGALWFTDVYAGQVVRLDIDSGESEIVAAVDGHPAGIGFLPDGRLIIAHGASRTLLRREADGSLVQHADLTDIATGSLNDMHVDASGRAYVGNYGDTSAPPAPPFPSKLALVLPDGTASAVADDMLFPNGCGLSADGRTLVVAETRATPGRLSAFAVAEDGTLSNRRTLVEFGEGVFPDGIAVAPDDSVWVASPFNNQLIHVSADGAILEEVEVPTPYAVALAGPDRDVLIACSSPSWEPEIAMRDRAGAILRVR